MLSAPLCGAFPVPAAAVAVAVAWRAAGPAVAAAGGGRVLAALRGRGVKSGLLGARGSPRRRAAALKLLQVGVALAVTVAAEGGATRC